MLITLLNYHGQTLIKMEAYFPFHFPFPLSNLMFDFVGT